MTAYDESSSLQVGLFNITNPATFPNPASKNCTVAAPAVGAIGEPFSPHTSTNVPDSECKNRIVGAAAGGSFPPYPRPVLLILQSILDQHDRCRWGFLA